MSQKYLAHELSKIHEEGAHSKGFSPPRLASGQFLRSSSREQIC